MVDNDMARGTFQDTLDSEVQHSSQPRKSGYLGHRCCWLGLLIALLFCPVVQGDVDSCKLYGTLQSAEGDPIVGAELWLTLSGPAYDSTQGRILSTEQLVARTDSNGYAAIWLVPTDNMLPRGREWVLKIRHEEHFKVAWSAMFSLSNDADSLDLADIGEDKIGRGD